MAKVQGPLFSAAAHGSIHTELTYSKRKTQNHTRFQKKQRDYTSTARGINRIKFKAAYSVWANLTQDEKNLLESEME